jgi:hypothetical protein
VRHFSRQRDAVKKQIVAAKDLKWPTVRLVMDRTYCETPANGVLWRQKAEYFAVVPPYIATALLEVMESWRKYVGDEADKRNEGTPAPVHKS